MDDGNTDTPAAVPSAGDLRPTLRYAAWGGACLLLTLGGVRIALSGSAWLDGLLSIAWLLAVVAAFDRLRRVESVWMAQTAIAGLALAALGLIGRQSALVAAALLAAATAAALSVVGRPAWKRRVAGSGLLALVLAVAALLLRFTDRPAAGTWMLPLLALGLPLANLAYGVIGAGLRRMGMNADHDDLVQLAFAPGTPARRAQAVLAAVGTGLGVGAVALSRVDPYWANVAAAGIAAVAFLLLPSAAGRWKPQALAPGARAKLLEFLLFPPRLERLLDMLLIAGALSAIFYREIGAAEFHPDESNWIRTSDFLEPFLRGEHASSVWTDSIWTVDQPPLARYLIGLGRLSGGYGPGDLNEVWDFEAGTTENFLRGALPSPGLLWWSRLPMATLSVVSGLGLYWLAAQSAGRLGGYAAVAMFAANDYLRATLVRAMSEGPLLAFLILAAWAGARAADSWKDAAGAGRPRWTPVRPAAWFALTGLLSGMAGAAKLTGLFAVLAGAALGLAAPLARPGALGRPARALFAALAPAVVALAAGAAFVGLNPYTYPDPVARSAQLAAYRLATMEEQQADGSLVDRALERRASTVGRRILQDYATLSFPGAWAVNLALFAAGAGYTARAALWYLAAGEGKSGSLVLVLFALAAGTPALFTPLDWDRYYLLPVVFSSTAIAVGMTRAAVRVLCMLRPSARTATGRPASGYGPDGFGSPPAAA